MPKHKLHGLPDGHDPRYVLFFYEHQRTVHPHATFVDATPTLSRYASRLYALHTP